MADEAGRDRAASADRGWIQIQQNTFTNWCNDRLKDTKFKVADLSSQFDDGVTLPSLLEVLAPHNKAKLKYKKNPRLQVQKTENLAIAFDFMKKIEKIELVNIGPQDVIEHNLKLMLGLVWTLIQRYQLGIGAAEEEPPPPAKTGAAPTQQSAPKKKKPSQSAKKILLGWVRANLPDMKVDNFHTDWNDGIKLSGLVNSMKPGLIPDYQTLNPDNRLENTTRAMDLAEEHFGIPEIIAPKDLCADKPDELSVLTYIGYYCNKDSIGKNNLLEWVNEKIPKYKVSNFTADWKDGMALGCLTDVVSGGNFAPYEEMSEDNPLENTEQSMDYAEKMGVPKIITPEEFISPSLDPVTMMTYLTYFKYATPTDEGSVVTVNGPGVSGDKIGKDTNFVIKGRIPEWATLDINITGPDGDKIPYNKLDSVANTIAVRYKIAVPGTHTVEVLINKEHVTGSPFTVHHIQPANSRNCYVSAGDLEKGFVGETSELTVNCVKGGAGQLRVDLKGPHGNIGTDINEVSDKVYRVKYTPTESGPHIVSIYWADNHIEKSPSTVRVVDPKKCTATGAGLSNAVLNQPAVFRVHTKDAGQSKLDVAVIGPDGVALPVSVDQDGPDEYICSYTPTARGDHSIDAKWEGIPIPGTPFRVAPSVLADPSKCIVIDLPTGYLRANKEAHFLVDTSAAGDGDLKVSAHGPSIPQKCDIQSIDSSNYKVSFSPFEVGELTVDVKFADGDVKDSPFKFKVNDPTKCNVNSSAISSGTYTIKQKVDFRVSTQFAGEGELTAKVHGPKGSEDFKIEDKGEGVYLIGFTPNTPGAHAIEIFFDNEAIPNTPVNFFVGAGSGSDDVVVIQPAADRKGLFIVDAPHEYKINASNANEGELTANCVGVFTGAKPKLDIVDNGNRHYSVLLTAAAPDEYKLNILWSNDPVPGSQFTINISDKPHPDKVLVRGPIYEIGSQDMELVANVTSAGSGEITASCRGQRAGSVPVEIDSTEPGTYEMKIKGTMCDLYTISVFWSDEHVPGSPFKVNNIPPNAGKVIVTKPDHFARSVRSVFKVDATDAGVGYLKAYCKAESSANLPVEIEKPDPLQERYRCTVTPIREDVYQLSILWSDKNVPDSPFTIDLVPKLHADRVIVEDPVFSTSGQPVLTNVDTTNAGNGKLTAECIGKVSGNVPVDIKETEVGKYVLEFMPPKEDDYKLRIFFENEEVPRSPQNISIHPIQEIFGYVILDPPESEIIITDYLGEIHQPPPENVEKDPAEMSMMIGDILRMDIVNPTPEKVPELESIHPIEPEKELKATAVGDVNGSAEIEVKKNGPDDYVIKFNPTKPDRYVITVMNGNEELPESPVIVRYITPVDASKCFIFDLEKNSAHPLIGETVQFGVDASNAGKGDLRVTTDGPSDSQNESNLKIEEDPDKSGVYHITYRLPEVAGEQRVHVQWSNNNIPGSPLVFNVASGSAITGETVYPYGSLVVLGLNAECKPKELDAFAVLEGTNQRVKLKATKVGKGQFKLSGQPTTPGHYAVHVRIKEIDVAGSPYRIRYSDPPNPSKVKVDIQPSDLAFLYYPIVFNIDTKEAGLGDVALRSNVRRKTKDKSPEFEVVDNKDGTYTATYIPMQTTIHSFEVLFANQPVPGFPVKMNVIEKPAQIDHILSSNLNLMEVNKSVALYFRLPPGDSISSITASATGRTIQDPDFKLENVKDNLCCARFTPSVPDDYQLEVQHRNSPIAGSPFPVKVVDKESFEPSKSTELFQNPPVVEAKRPFTLILPIIQPDMSQGDFVTDIDGPPESDVVSSGVIGDGHGAFALSFTPDLPGDYVIHVKDSKEDCPISGSPYRVIVKEFHSDPTKCFIIPEDAQLFEKSQRFGKPVNFRISTIDAGPGTLNITSRGPGKADVKIFDNNDGTYTCEFTPSVPGQYGIDILWDTQHIEGSPYNLNFKNRKKKVITGLNLDAENFRVGIPHRFKLHCDEVGDGELEVNIKPASAAQVKVSNLGSFTYQVEILPFEQGHHELVVHYGGTHILGSPYNVTFNERGDASKCKMISNDVEQVGDDQDHVVFIVSTKDAGNGKLTAHVDNPNSGERDPVLIDKLEEDIYKVHFDLGSEAEYQLTIKYDGNHIEGSPFKLLFADQIDASICRAEGDGLRISQIEKEAKFSVYTEGAGEADLKVQIVSKEGYEIYPHVSNLGEGEYEVSYNSTKPGEYMISIQWGEDNIPSSPFSMKCFVPVQAAYLKVIDPPSEAFLETPIEVKVKPINEMNEEGELMIMAKSRQANIVGTVKQEEDGSFTCHLEPVLPGRYVVKVTLNGDSIQNSPFKVKVVEPPKPQNVKAYGPGLKDGFVGQEGNFTLETGEAGSGTLSVRVHGPKGAFRINMRRHPDNERTILVRYDPKYSGRYSIDVTWSEEHIPGSPFKVEILEQKEKERSLTNGTSNEEESKANENEETNDKDEEKIDTVADVHVST